MSGQRHSRGAYFEGGPGEVLELLELMKWSNMEEVKAAACND